jgi:hypothetical protein
MLKREAIKQLKSVQLILNQIQDEDYILPLPTLKNATIGKHVRHIVEFYKAVLFSSINETVNYDERERNTLLEENVKYTNDFIAELIDVLGHIELNRRILLISEYQNEQVEMESSLFREITYNIEHTVHHLAIIGIAIPIHLNYINLSENFGYAESTVKYQSTQKAS